MYSIENLEKELNTKELKSLYLFFGEEKYLIETNTKKNKKHFWRSH